MEYSAARHIQKETDLQMNVETATERDSLHTHDAPAGTRQELQVSTDFRTAAQRPAEALGLGNNRPRDRP